MGVNGATDTVQNAYPAPRNPGTDSSKQVKEFQEAVNRSTTSNNSSQQSQGTSNSNPIILATRPPINLGNPIGKQGAPLQAGAAPATASSSKMAAFMGDTEMPLNQKVLNFANSKVGQQVGSGDCWDLPEEALTKSGGESSKVLTDTKGKSFEEADYVWGSTVPTKDAQPGDVIQFKDHSFTVEWPDGHSEWQTRGHHSAIVKSKNADGTLTVIESHVTVLGKKMNGNRAEKKDTLKLTKEHTIFLEDGTFTFKGESVRVTTTGTATTYRPQIAPRKSETPEGSVLAPRMP
jgi:hypothetical protein